MNNENLFQPMLAVATTTNPEIPSVETRSTQWIDLCAFLLNSLSGTAKEALQAASDHDARLDILKDVVTTAHRLFSLERALADKPTLAGENAPSEFGAVGDRLRQFLAEIEKSSPLGREDND